MFQFDKLETQMSHYKQILSWNKNKTTIQCMRYVKIFSKMQLAMNFTLKLPKDQVCNQLALAVNYMEYVIICWFYKCVDYMKHQAKVNMAPQGAVSQTLIH